MKGWQRGAKGAPKIYDLDVAQDTTRHENDGYCIRNRIVEILLTLGLQLLLQSPRLIAELITSCLLLLTSHYWTVAKDRLLTRTYTG